MSTTEWGDLPTSSDFFANEFFGDDLMDMYTHSNDDLEDDMSPNDEEVSNGMLVAMNAAAMDGDLFGSSAEFIPAAVSSSIALMDPPEIDTISSPVANEEPSQSDPVETAITSVKRTVTNDDGGQGAPAAKKPKGPTAAPAVPVKPAPAAVVTTTVSVSSLKPVPVTSTAPPVIKPGSIPGNLPTSISVPPPRVAASAPKVPAPASTVKMPVGGVAHQVVPRPPAAPYAATVARRAPPPPAMTKAGGIVAQAAAHNKIQPTPMQVSSSGVKRAVTEADFKGVASAAVSSLIQSATGGTTHVKAGKGLAGPTPTEKPVDTSTSHVLSLTSQSWITACSNPIPTPVQSTSEIDKAARNARRAALTQEERAKQNRDRNREHARNTRLRKKAYVEELKRTLTEIVAQRDAAEVEKMHSAQREREQREVRFRVMEEFLKLRGRNELNATRWVAILEDGFTLTLPRTYYRKMVNGDKSPGEETEADAESLRSVEQVIRGAGPVMQDSQHLSNFLQTIGNGNQAGEATQIQIVYRCDRKRFYMDSNTTFMDFSATTVGAVNKGLQKEVVFKGSARSLFSPASNKLISVDINFDTGAILHQLERMGHIVENYAPEDDVTEAALAAANAANEADALLDSLQMPQIFVDSNVGPVSVSSDDASNQL
jgi:hypothetical protein